VSQKTRLQAVVQGVRKFLAEHNVPLPEDRTADLTDALMAFKKFIEWKLEDARAEAELRVARMNGRRAEQAAEVGILEPEAKALATILTVVSGAHLHTVADELRLPEWSWRGLVRYGDAVYRQTCSCRASRLVLRKREAAMEAEPWREAKPWGAP
jgi:hypothetical protein